MNITAQTVINKSGKVDLFVSESSGVLPANYMLVATKAKSKVALRIAGGCKNMSEQDKLDMLDFFATALIGYSGVLFSGATRQLTADGLLDPMVTDVPGYVAQKNDGIIALGTAPRTDAWSLQGESAFILDGYGTRPNPTMDAILLVQDGPDATLDWDGDVPVYLKIMESWRSYAGFEHVGLISWNGGAVTEAEFRATANRKWPTILIQGSGRATDDAIQAIVGELPGALQGDHVYVVDKSDPLALRQLLIDNGFILII
jgi:hypothetical protein